MQSLVRTSVATASLAVVSLAISSPCFAWGSKGHYIVNVAASELSTSAAGNFFRENQETLGKFSNTPDGLWKRKDTYEKERGTHFFHWDVYKKSNLLGDYAGLTAASIITKQGHEFLDENGSAMFRIADIYRRMVKALQAKDWKTTIQMAGVMGHYVGDISQPMHVSSDYDGQSIGRPGVHKYFESTLVDEVPHDRLTGDVVDDGQGRRSGFDRRGGGRPGEGAVKTLVFHEGEVAFGELAGVLENFDRDGSQDDRNLKNYYGPRMGFASAILASIWDMAVEEAGVSSGFPNKAVDVDEPEWFPLDGKGEAPAKGHDTKSGGKRRR
ncbi:MAG: hypothetical protein RIQ81_2553 [Pseudomonadota bacterium]|jgi:hypothetical protein